MRRLIMKLQMSALVILVIAGCSDNAVDSVAGGDGGMDAGGRDTGQMDASTDPPSTDALTDAPDTKDADSTKDAGDTEDADNAKDAAREDGGWPDASDASPDASRSDDAGDGGLVEPYRSVTVSSGEDHTCAVRTDGHVLCWGSNALGQLGNGGDLTARRTRPVAVVGIDTATAVAVGDYRSCALERAGTVQCWGYAGPLPDQQPRIVSTPTRVAGIADATAISTGGSHTCVLRAEGSVLCWGSNEFGQLGNATMAQSGGSFVDSPVAVQGLTGATALAAGRAHTCALTNAGISCWGKNQFGELGNGGTRDSNVPVALGPLSGALNIAASVATFVARADGDVSAWGVGTGGLLTPAAGVIRLAGVRAVATGPMAICRKGDVGAPNALLCRSLDGSNAAWAPKAKWSTVAASITAQPTGLSVGGHHACAQFDDGIVRCWGSNTSGQLGNGGVSPSSTALVVVGF
jgi:alpha-tubulin suppressor-like RCC1 family protein